MNWYWKRLFTPILPVLVDPHGWAAAGFTEPSVQVLVTSGLPWGAAAGLFSYVFMQPILRIQGELIKVGYGRMVRNRAITVVQRMTDCALYRLSLFRMQVHASGRVTPHPPFFLLLPPKR